MLKEYKLSLSGVDCAVVETGNPKGAPVLFFHGWLDNLASFSSLFPHLADFRLIAVDFPGHGGSSHLPKGMSYHFLDLVYVIQDCFEQLGLMKANIVGHSMGGAAATLFTSVSDKVERLVLLETIGPLTVSPENTLELMQSSLNSRASVKNKERRIFSSVEQALTVRALHSKMKKELIEPIVTRGVEQFADGYRWSSDPRLKVASINRLTEPQLIHLIESIKVPILLVEATQGLFKDYPVAQARKAYFNELQLELIEGGHHVHLEQPKQVAQLINTFLVQ